MSRRAPEELVAFSDHLLYDVRMVFAITNRLGSQHISPGGSLPWDVEMSLLETLAIKARALTDFLWLDSSRHPEDAHAADYFPCDEWDRMRPPKGKVLASARSRVGSEIAHLSYHRAGVAEDATWHCGPIALSIGECLRVFIAKVPRANVAASFRDQAWQALPECVRTRNAFSAPPDDWPPRPSARSARRTSCEPMSHA